MQVNIFIIRCRSPDKCSSHGVLQIFSITQEERNNPESLGLLLAHKFNSQTLWSENNLRKRDKFDPMLLGALKGYERPKLNEVLYYLKNKL